MIEHVNHTRTKYELKNALVTANVRTGVVLAEIPALSTGDKNYQINISHIYNPTLTTRFMRAIGGYWKLNLEQILIQRHTPVGQRNIFEYFDESGIMHEFIFMGVIGNVFYYYDTSGLNLTLTMNGEGPGITNRVITDETGNRLEFDVTGRLTASISGENAAIRKTYTYQNGFLHEVFDSRRPTRRVRFLYRNRFLSEMQYLANGRVYQTYHYQYDRNNNLRTIARRASGEGEQVMHIFYFASTQRIRGLYDTRDSEAIRIIYETGQTEGINKVSLIESGIARATIVRRGLLRVSGPLDVPYVGEVTDISFTANERIVENRFLYRDNFNRTTITNERNVSLDYHFNQKGFLTSVLEPTPSGLRELEKRPGVNMLAQGSSFQIINGDRAHQITIRNADYSSANLFNANWSNIRNYRNRKCQHFDNFVISFWLRLDQRLSRNLVKIESRSLSPNRTEENLGTFDNTAIGVWQYVEVQVRISGKDLSDLRLSFPGGVDGNTLLLVGMKITYGERAELFLTATEFRPNGTVRHREILENIDLIGFWDTFTPFERGIRINTDFYITESDVQSTYNSFMKRTGAHFVFSASEGTWKILVSSARFIFFNQNSWPVAFFGNDSTCEFFGEARSADDKMITETTFNLVRGNPDCIDMRQRARLDRRETMMFIRTDFQGRLRMTLDEYGVQDFYTYNNWGASTKTTVPPNDAPANILNERFVHTINDSVYAYTERAGLKQNTTLFSDPFGQVRFSQFEVFNIANQRDNNLMYQLNYTQNNFFDKLNSITDNVRGSNSLGNNQIARNVLNYDKVGRLEQINSEGNNSGFSYEYSQFGDLIKNYVQAGNSRRLVSEMTINRNAGIVTARQFRLLSAPDTVTVNSNKYEMVERINENNSLLVFSRQNLAESESAAEITSYRDPFENRNYIFRYSDGNEVTDYEIEGHLRIESQTNGTLHTMTNFTHHNQFRTRIAFDDQYFINPRIIETHEEITWQNSINIKYSYDVFGRPSGKVTTDRIRLSMENVRTMTETYTYIPGTGIKINVSGTNMQDISYQMLNSGVSTGGNSYEREIIITILNQHYNLNIFNTYDACSRLLTEISGDNSKRVGRRFTYNTDGSINSEEIDNNASVVGPMFEPVINGVITNYNYQNGQLRTIVSPIGNSLSFEYDNLGNCTNYNGTTLTYTRGSLLLDFAGRGTYSYKNQGVRFRKVSLGRTIDYYHDGNKLLAERETANRYIRFIYDLDEVVGFMARGFDNPFIPNDQLRTEEFPYYYIKDTTGNIVGIRSDNFVGVLITYEYEAFGNHTITVRTPEGNTVITAESHPNHIGVRNPLRWKSQYYDSETQLYWIEGRYYSPLMRQYITPESPEDMAERAIIPNSLNSYLLTVANPVSLVYNSGNINTSIPLYYDSGELTWFQARWRIFMNNAFFQAINRKTSRLSEWLDNQSPVLKAIGTAALAVGLVVATVKTGGLAGLTFFAAKQTAGAKLVVSVKVKKVFSAAKAGAWIGGVSGAVSGGINDGVEGIIDGFAFGAITGFVSGAGAKAVGLSKLGLVQKIAAKASVYAGTSMYGQAIFYGEVDFRKVGISAFFGGVGGVFDPFIPKNVVPQVVTLIGLAATKEATLVLTKGDEDNLWK